MSKLGVGVGDEFPADEIVQDENGVVHHHHYYRPRRRGGWLRIILWIMLIGALFRGMNYLMYGPPGPHWHDGHWANGHWVDGWNGGDGWAFSPYAPLAGAAVTIAIIGGALWLLNRRDERGPRRDA